MPRGFSLRQECIRTIFVLNSAAQHEAPYRVINQSQRVALMYAARAESSVVGTHATEHGEVESLDDGDSLLEFLDLHNPGNWYPSFYLYSADDYELADFLARLRRGDVATGRALVHAEADVNGLFLTSRPLMVSVHAPDMRLADLLIANGARTEIPGETSLMHEVVATGRVDLVDYFVQQRDALPDFRNVLGQTPLFVAAVACDHSMAARLLRFGANPNARSLRIGTDPATTPVDVACDERMRTLLQQHGGSRTREGRELDAQQRRSRHATRTQAMAAAGWEEGEDEQEDARSWGSTSDSDDGNVILTN